MIATRCIGLIGGLGVGATIYYYRNLARCAQEQSRELNLVMVHAESERVHEFVAAREARGLADYLAGFVARLAQAGAAAAVIPAVTPHFCLRKLREISPLPLLDIFAPLNRELAVRRIRRAAVFGTRFVMQSALYGMVPGVDLVATGDLETAAIHDLYWQLVQTGQASPEQRAALTNLARDLCARASLDAIILAGTDFTSLFGADRPDFPSIDCAALHVRSIAEWSHAS